MAAGGTEEDVCHVSYTGTACLCKTIDIVGLNAQFILNILPHLLTPCLRAEDTCGRSDDMLIVKGVNVFPSQIETVLLEQGYPANYQII